MGVIQYVNRPGPIPLEPVVDMLKNEAAGFAIDFVTGKAFARGEPGYLPRDVNGFLNYASPSTKYVRNKSGVLVPGKTLRCDHDAQGNPLGLLIEGQRTNAWNYSHQLHSTAWHKVGATTSPEGHLAPDGTMTATKLTEDTSGSVHYIRRVFNTILGSAEALTFFAKAGERKIVRFGQHGGASSVWSDNAAPSLMVNLETGTILDRIGLPDGSFNLERLPNGWWKFAFGKTNSTTTATTVGMGVATCDDEGNYGYTGDGTSSIYVWGFQREQGFSFPTSTIKTEASEVTRAADIVSLATAMFPFNQQGGTLIADFTPVYEDTNSEQQWIAARLHGEWNNYVQMFLSTTSSRSGQPGFTMRVGGNVTGTPGLINELSPPGGAPQKWALSYDATVLRGGLNGHVSNTGDVPIKGGELPSPTHLYVGSGDNGSLSINGHMHSLTYLPRLITADELIARTTP